MLLSIMLTGDSKSLLEAIQVDLGEVTVKIVLWYKGCFWRAAKAAEGMQALMIPTNISQRLQKLSGSFPSSRNKVHTYVEMLTGMRAHVESFVWSRMKR
jgi:hypothetical protein